MEAGNQKWTKKILTASEQLELEKKIKKLEEETGLELVVAILKTTDHYFFAPLAFAIFFTFLTSFFLLHIVHYSNYTFFIFSQIIIFYVFLFIGNIPSIKRLSIPNKKMDEEFNEKALSLFFTLKIKETSSRTGSLLVISLFERKMRLLVDESIGQKISQEDLDAFIKTLIPSFKKKNYFQGLNQSLKLIEEKYKKAFQKENKPTSSNQLSNTIHWFDFS